MESLGDKIGLEDDTAFAIYSLDEPLRTSFMEWKGWVGTAAARAWMFLQIMLGDYF